MKTLQVCLLGLSLIVVAGTTAAQARPDATSPKDHLKIAITFDDLPAHGPLPPGVTRMDIASKIIAALRDAKVTGTYGFVNGALDEKEPQGEQVLQAWTAAGNPVGNHTWSHPSLNQLTVEQFEDEITRNEPLLRKVSDGKDWHWFRYPFLHEGDTPKKRAAVRKFLGEHGYKIATVTMSFGDYLWNEPYARCKSKGDEKAIELLKSSYLEAADESVGWYRQMSQALFGRDIPYVLLMHIGALDAELLPKLLDLYRQKGVEFVSLQEAEKDPVYKVDTKLTPQAGPDSLEGMMKERGLAIPPHKITNPNFNDMCK
jgi:peptidoglycan-N-acetylglucosamine deacetylase